MCLDSDDSNESNESNEDLRMSLIDLDALDASELQTVPFDYIVVPDFLPPSALKEVNADYPIIDSAANHDLRDVSYGP